MKVIFLISILWLSSCGPGASDFDTPIINGYFYNNAGGNEQDIVYTGNEKSKEIVIDSRVDSFFLHGEDLFVARRPIQSFEVNGVMDSKLLDVCEYWVINTKSHVIVGPFEFPLKASAVSIRNELGDRFAKVDLNKLRCK